MNINRFCLEVGDIPDLNVRLEQAFRFEIDVSLLKPYPGHIRIELVVLALAAQQVIILLVLGGE